jgi:hypothetical protein
MGIALNPVKEDRVADVKRESPKKEFENLIRDIRDIFSKSRADCSFMVDTIINEAENKAKWRITWINRGIGVQVVGALVVIGAGMSAQNKKLEVATQVLQIASKVTDAVQGYCNTAQVDHESFQQRMQQAITQYNALDQRFQAILTSIDSMEQRLNQMEQEQFMNR